MKIAYLLHRFPEKTDTFIRREIRSLQKLGTDVRVVSVWRPQEPATTTLVEEWSDLTTYLLPRSPVAMARALLEIVLSSPGAFMRALCLACKTARPGWRGSIYQLCYFGEAVLAAAELRRIGVAHVHNHFGDHSGIVTMLASVLSGIGYSISFHGPHVFFDAANGAFAEKIARADFIRCISHFCRSQLVVFSGIPDVSKLKIIHCGLDLGNYAFRLPRHEVRTIFCAARLAPEKGFQFLVEAVGILHAKGIAIDLRIAGEGPARGGLETLARKTGIYDHVTLLGNLDEQEVTRELANADLFVLPSLAEGVPVSIMEAMAIGIPVIATNIAGTSELVEDGKNGLLVRPTDAQAIADAVMTMIEDHELRLRAAAAGRAKVSDEFDVVKETSRLFECLAGLSSMDKAKR